MADLIWTHDTTPDRPGIWLRRTSHGHVSAISIVGDNHGYPKGTYCFVMNWPEVKEPVRYRDVTAADVGREVDVCDYNFPDPPRKRELLAILPVDLEYRFVTREASSSAGISHWKHARILDSGDDGEPKREAREWWVNGIYAYKDRLNAGTRGIHVREVID